MKKLIRYALLAFSICTAAVACAEFDDTEIWDSIKDLQERVSQLEKDVQKNVEALQSMISVGSVQSCTFDAETGKAIITLVDGKTITIDQTVTGYSLMTVQKGQDGNYYWSVCKDGQTSLLLVDGKPVPLAVTPALKLSDQGEWMISVDGGNTWVATGIFHEKCECPEEDENNGNEGGTAPEQPVPSASFFKDVQLDGDTLVLTLMDGTVIRLAVTGEAVFAALTDTLWFAKGGIEKIALLQMSNLKAFTITEKPEGWKARVQTDSLIVTAPSDIKGGMGSGDVKLLGVFNGAANPEIVTVHVRYENPVVLKSGVGTTYDVKLSDHALEDIEGYVMEVWKASEFTREKAAAWLNSEDGYAAQCYTESARYDVSAIEGYDPTEAYVVFVAEHIPVKMLIAGGASYEAADLQIVEIGSTQVKAGFSNIRYDSAHLYLELSDMPQYHAGFSELGFWEAIGRDNMLETLNQGNMQPLSEPLYDGPAAAFPGGLESDQILPSTDYLVWIVPVKESGQYVAEDFIIYSFTSAPIVSDQSVAVPSCEITEVTYGGFSAKVTPPAGAYKTYAAIRKAGSIPEDEQQSVTEIIGINKFASGSETLSISTNSFSADDEVYLLAVTLTQDGRYGKVHKQKVDLKKLEYREDMSVAMSSEVNALGDVTVTMEFTGNPSTVTYYCTNANFFGDETLQDMLAMGQIGAAHNDIPVSEISGGKVVLSGLTLGVEYTFYALVKDAEGRPSRMSKITFIPAIFMDYVLSDNPDYGYGMPEIKVSKVLANYKMAVDMPETCLKYWLFVGDFEYMSGSSTSDVLVDVYGATDKLISMQLEALGATEHTTSLAQRQITVRSTTRIYMAWQDDKGRYHAVYAKNPSK